MPTKIKLRTLKPSKNLKLWTHELGSSQHYIKVRKLKAWYRLGLNSLQSWCKSSPSSLKIVLSKLVTVPSIILSLINKNDFVSALLYEHTLEGAHHDKLKTQKKQPTFLKEKMISINLICKHNLVMENAFFSYFLNKL